MTHEIATAAEVDRKLREDFRRRMRDFGYTGDAIDPALAVLFRTLATEVEALYRETGRIRLALLDELIEGLGMSARMARPAQTIVRFAAEREPVFLAAGTELLCEAESGTRLTFTTDASITASQARIAFAAAHENGMLRLLPGVAMSEEVEAAKPSLEPVPATAGRTRELFLAIETLPQSHLGHHGFFFDLSPYALKLQRALLTEPWCLARPDGSLSADGLLRPRRANGGHRILEWLLPAESGSTPGRSSGAPALPDGFYAGRVFAFPSVPTARRWLCRAPLGLERALEQLFGGARLFERPRAWLRISIPLEAESLEQSLSAVMMHATSASEIECLNETVYFEREGTSIPVSREAGTDRCLVAPLSVVGESGEAYVTGSVDGTQPEIGRYVFRNGRIHLQPGRRHDRTDRFANLRLWVSHGEEANHVVPGRVHSFLRRSADQRVQVWNPTAAAGGSNGESYTDAHGRLAQALFSRERLITEADLVAAVRAFDRRIHSTEVAVRLRRTSAGLERVHSVVAHVQRHDFIDPSRESAILSEELSEYLQARSIMDVPVSVEVRAE